jgi:hypothetical protein
MNTDTKQHIQPYAFYLLPKSRVMITVPGTPAKIVLHKTQIVNKLQGMDGCIRDLSAHERIMLETALKVIEEK